MVYVSNQNSATITPIPAATGQPGKAITVGATPVAVAITPDGAIAFVLNYGSATVTSIRTATNTIITTSRTGAKPFAIAVTP